MRATRLTRRGLLAGASAAILAAALPAMARPLFLRGGSSRGGSPPSQATTFTVANTAAATSLGYKRIGMVFRDGDAPAGSRIKIQRGGVDVPAQFDNRSSWASGSLRVCTACIRDTDFTASESRAYAVIVETGAFDNASSAALSDVTAATDFQVAFTAMTDFDGTTTTALADHAASLNTHAAVATRVTKYESGPVCDSWMIWGMAASGGVDHAHLKTNWYVTRWKNASGAAIAHEVCAVMTQDWWAVAGKKKLIYTATLKNGATVIETYGGSIDSAGTRSATLEHVYQAQWATVRLTNDDQHASRHWVGATRPTLLHKPDRAYWISTGMVPPIDTTPAYAMPASYTTGPINGIYQPNIYQPGSAFSHRAAIDGTGGYTGRGILPNMDSIAFATQAAADVRTLRVNAFAGLHAPLHLRSEKTRTRPGDAGPDTANTLHPLILQDERGTATPAAFYDFTADGLPAPAHAYATTLSQASYGTGDGYVTPPGQSISGTSKWVFGGATTTDPKYGGPYDTSHAVAYSYFAYLLEGERYFLEATLDLGHFAAQGRHGNNFGGMPPLDWGTIYPNTPTTTWAGIGVHGNSAGTTRIIGWGANMMACMVIVPDGDAHANYVKTFVANNGKWLKSNIDLIPASGNGAWAANATGAVSPWMEAFIVLGCYTAYDRTKDANWLSPAEFTAKGPVNWANFDRVGQAAAYRAFARPMQSANWNATTNDWFSDGWFELTGPSSISAATDLITISTNEAFTLTAGDVVIAADSNANLNPVTIPSEMSAGTRYYVINPTGSTSFQLATTPGGAPIDFTVDYTGKYFGIRYQSANNPANQGTPVTSADSYADINRAATVLAKRHNHALATQLTVDRYTNYRAAIDVTGWATWNLSDTA